MTKYDAWVTNYDSFDETDRDDDVPMRIRRENNQGRNTQNDTRQINFDPWGTTTGGQPMGTQDYMDRIWVFEEHIVQLRRDMMRREGRQKQPEPQGWEPPFVDFQTPRARAEIPKKWGLNRIHLLHVGDPTNPISPFTEEIMVARISRKFKLITNKAHDKTGDPANHVRPFMNSLLLQPVTEVMKCQAFPQALSGMAQF